MYEWQFFDNNIFFVRLLIANVEVLNSQRV